MGSIRRKCVDHFVVLGAAHLRRILRSYTRYYNDIRTHRSLDKDAPVSRPIQRTGIIKSHAILGGLNTTTFELRFFDTVFGGGIRKVARHQQFFGIRSAIERVKQFGLGERAKAV